MLMQFRSFAIFLEKKNIKNKTTTPLLNMKLIHANKRSERWKERECERETTPPWNRLSACEETHLIDWRPLWSTLFRFAEKSTESDYFSLLLREFPPHTNSRHVLPFESLPQATFTSLIQNMYSKRGEE